MLAVQELTAREKSSSGRHIPDVNATRTGVPKYPWAPQRYLHRYATKHATTAGRMAASAECRMSHTLRSAGPAGMKPYECPREQSGQVSHTHCSSHCPQALYVGRTQGGSRGSRGNHRKKRATTSHERERKFKMVPPTQPPQKNEAHADAQSRNTPSLSRHPSLVNVHDTATTFENALRFTFPASGLRRYLSTQ